MYLANEKKMLLYKIMMWAQVLMGSDILYLYQLYRHCLQKSYEVLLILHFFFPPRYSEINLLVTVSFHKVYHLIDCVAGTILPATRNIKIIKEISV